MVSSLLTIVVCGLLAAKIPSPARYWTFLAALVVLIVPVKLACDSFATGAWFNDIWYICREGFSHFLSFSESPGNVVVAWAVLSALFAACCTTAYASGQRGRLAPRQGR